MIPVIKLKWENISDYLTGDDESSQTDVMMNILSSEPVCLINDVKPEILRIA